LADPAAPFVTRHPLEKDLRDAAAAEVALHNIGSILDESDASTGRKRKTMNADEKAKQK
jgi:hypothetical protein